MPSKSFSRRQLLQTSAAVALSGSLLVRTAWAAPTAKVLEIKTVSQIPYYHGWPTLARRKNGQLLLVYSGGREGHVCPFGRVELMTSDDGGQTWTFPRVLLDGPIDDRDAGVVETPNGSLLVTTFTSLAYEPILKKAEQDGKWDAKQLARWQGAHNRISAAERKKDLGVWMIRSTDGGVNWSTKYDCLVSSPHGPIALWDGRMLYPGKDLWRPGERVGVCQSTDDGQSWQWLSTIQPRPGDNPAEYHELHGIEAKDGRIIVHIRNHNKPNAGETLQTESTDGGKTWSTPRSIGVWGLPSHLTRMEGDRLLMSYGYRKPPFGNQARVSEDNGKTWSEPVTISDDGAGGDLGYPSTVQLDNGEFVTVWYEKRKDSPRSELRQARWTLG
jgi:sialidase-1